MKGRQSDRILFTRAPFKFFPHGQPFIASVPSLRPRNFVDAARMRGVITERLRSVK